MINIFIIIIAPINPIFPILFSLLLLHIAPFLVAGDAKIKASNNGKKNSAHPSPKLHQPVVVAFAVPICLNYFYTVTEKLDILETHYIPTDFPANIIVVCSVTTNDEPTRPIHNDTNKINLLIDR